MTGFDLKVLRRISKHPYITTAEISKKMPNAAALEYLRHEHCISGMPEDNWITTPKGEHALENRKISIAHSVRAYLLGIVISSVAQLIAQLLPL